MRTQDEIVACIKELDPKSFLGFHRDVLVPYLDFKHAQEFLEPDVYAKDWLPSETDRDTMRDEMAEYMKFGIQKALDRRGISAVRTVEKMRCWLWLLEDEETLAFACGSSNYPPYRAPILRRICEKYGLPQPVGDEAWENMAKGWT